MTMHHATSELQQLLQSERELTEDQQIFHACWGGQIDTINSVEELQALLQTVEEEA